MIERLEEERTRRLMAMGEMCASIAHEIRNPLGSMELFCSLLEKDLRAQPELLQLAEQVHTGIRAINRIITNCLHFSANTTPQREVIGDAKSFLETAVSLTERGETTIHLEHRGGEGIVADPYLIQQALLNLLRNGAEAAGSHGRVELRSEVEGATWRLSVTDDGDGIAEESQSRIFEPFFTTKRDGTGLGLAITHAIVRAHGGSITVESVRGKGTTFFIEIPIIEEGSC